MESVLTWYRSGGPLMLPLLLIGLLGVVLLAERVRLVIHRSRITPRPFMERVISLAKAGRLEEALSLCAEHHAVLPDLGLVLLRSRSSNEDELQAIANASTLTVVPPLTRGLRWLPMLAQLALLVGVLGAVLNLHEALGDGATSATQAVRYALQPLGAAVLTCLPLVVGHSYLQHHVQGTLEHMEEFSARLINAMLGRPDVRLGHRD